MDRRNHAEAQRPSPYLASNGSEVPKERVLLLGGEASKAWGAGCSSILTHREETHFSTVNKIYSI